MFKLNKEMAKTKSHIHTDLYMYIKYTHTNIYRHNTKKQSISNALT